MSSLLGKIIDAIEMTGKNRTPSQIVQIIDKSFIEVDNLIMKRALLLQDHKNDQTKVTKPILVRNRSGKSAVKFPTAKPVGYAGSCAIVLIIVDSMLFVAHTG